MKSYFNLYIICIISLFTLGSSISKQESSIPDVDAYAKRVFEILISQDSVAYKNELEITESELDALVNQFVNGDSTRQKRNAITKEQAFENEKKEGKEKLSKMKKVFFEFDKIFKERNIDATKCNYLYSIFRLSNEREAPEIVMGKISVIFNYEGKRYSIKIRESVVVNNKWKIISISNYIDWIDKPLNGPVSSETTIVDSAAVIPANAPAEYSKTQNSNPNKKATPKKKVVKK